MDDALMHTLVKNAQVQMFISCTKIVQYKIPDNMHITIMYSNTPQSFNEIHFTTLNLFTIEETRTMKLWNSCARFDNLYFQIN